MGSLSLCFIDHRLIFPFVTTFQHLHAWPNCVLGMPLAVMLGIFPENLCTPTLRCSGPMFFFLFKLLSFPVYTGIKYQCFSKFVSRAVSHLVLNILRIIERVRNYQAAKINFSLRRILVCKKKY